MPLSPPAIFRYFSPQELSLSVLKSECATPMRPVFMPEMHASRGCGHAPTGPPAIADAGRCSVSAVALGDLRCRASTLVRINTAKMLVGASYRASASCSLEMSTGKRLQAVWKTSSLQWSSLAGHATVTNDRHDTGNADSGDKIGLLVSISQRMIASHWSTRFREPRPIS
jgi:hypothetical protein